MWLADSEGIDPRAPVVDEAHDPGAGLDGQRGRLMSC